MRILCEFKKWFGKVKNPCRRVLAEMDGVIIKEKEGEIEVKGTSEIVLKCNGCGKKTTIKIVGGK